MNLEEQRLHKYLTVSKLMSLSGHSPIKYVINLFPNVRSQAQELAVDTMKSRL